MKETIVYRVSEGPFRYQGWPTVTQDENGVLYAVCSGRRVQHVCPFGINLMFVSRDGGQTWSVPMIVNDTQMDDRDGGLCYLGNGKLLLSWFNTTKDFYLKERDSIERDSDAVSHDLLMGMLKQYESMADAENQYGSFVRISEDYGMTWGEKIPVPVSAPHGPIYTRSGRLLYLGIETPNYLDGDAMCQRRIMLSESLDGGKTWEMLSDLGVPKGCTHANLSEPHLVELPDGRLLAAVRGDREPVFEGFSMFLSTSEDGGKTWTPLQATEISGAPPFFTLLRDGRVMLSYSRRRAPFGIAARISEDGGKSFGAEMMISTSDNGDLGYPSTVELSDGSFVTVFYKRYGTDRRTSIFSTKWNLNDFLKS